jgi:formamidopyrimidine-DNA glycosylase
MDCCKRSWSARRFVLQLLRQPAAVICFMPELAEVEWYRKQWATGRAERIVDLTLHAQKRVFRETDTRELRRHLTGQILLGSEARGKRMIFRFSGNNWLGVHLGMTGTLRVEAGTFQAAKHDHLVLYQKSRALVYRDTRQFGRIRFHHGPNAPDWWEIGVPEIISPQFDRLFVDRFLQRHAKAPIKAVLLLQNGFSGIGNWMADEILWRAKVLPSRRSRRLKTAEREALFRQTKFVTRKSLQTLGRDYSDPPVTWLIHQRWKPGGQCPRHGTPLRRARIAGRTTAWCPQCQR